MGGIVTATAKMQADTGAHVLWVHHVPHEAERMRGHGALLGAVDTAIHVTKLESCRKATVTKANDSEEGEAVTFDLESVTIGDDGTTAPVVVAADAGSEIALKAIKLSPAKKLALDALDEVTTEPAPPSFGLPPGVRVADIEGWKTELRRRGVLDPEHSNPTVQFKRVWQPLLAAHLIGRRDSYVWRANT